MASLNLLPVNKKVHLGYSIKRDGIIIFRSSQLNLGSTANHTEVNLLSDNGDILLHIFFRLDEDMICFNACRSGNWFNEEKIAFGDRLRGHNHTVGIYDHGDNYQILFNGKTGHYFKKQLVAERVFSAVQGRSRITPFGPNRDICITKTGAEPPAARITKPLQANGRKVKMRTGDVL